MNYFPLDPNLNVCRCSSNRTLIDGLNFNTRSNLCTLSEIGRFSISMQIALFRDRLLCTAGGGGGGVTIEISDPDPPHKDFLYSDDPPFINS